MDDEKPAVAGGQTSSVTGESAPPLLVRIQGAEWSLPAGPAYLVGRDPGCHIVVAHPSVSGHHAELHQAAGGYRLVDLDSSNGTYVNERRITDALLAEGDVVGIGSATFRLAQHELRAVSDSGLQAGETLPPPAAQAPAAPLTLVSPTAAHPVTCAPSSRRSPCQQTWCCRGPA